MVTPDVCVVTPSAMLAQVVEEALQARAGPVRCRDVASIDPAAPSPLDGAGVVLAVPQSWQEMARWVPGLKTWAESQWWLVLAEPRVAGMFVSDLPQERSAVVSTQAPLEELAGTFRALVSGRAPRPVETLRMLFDRGVLAMPPEERGHRLTDKQLEIGCAVSHGLSDRRGARLLTMSEGTFGNHVCAILHALGLPDREAVRAYFDLALSRSPITFR